MQTSQQWWEATKADPAKFRDWLAKQYVGERTAVIRLQALISQCQREGLAAWKCKLLRIICAEEHKHASWIADLCATHDVPLPLVSEKGASAGRYWQETLAEGKSLEDLFAVGALAEGMRLKRIKAIAADNTADQVVQDTFRAILDDEEGHAAIFTMLAGPEAIERNRGNHEAGYAALGLID